MIIYIISILKKTLYDCNQKKQVKRKKKDRSKQGFPCLLLGLPSEKDLSEHSLSEKKPTY
jgi:hypothetical protein